ncbi:hypothetical protein CBL_08405 [Carabus blaptoides fortunei]
MGKALNNKTSDMPANAVFSENLEALPHVICGDDAFPLKTYLMRPYSGRNLAEDKKIFNYRLSGARRISQNTFDSLSSIQSIKDAYTSNPVIQGIPDKIHTLTTEERKNIIFIFTPSHVGIPGNEQADKAVDTMKKLSVLSVCLVNIGHGGRADIKDHLKTKKHTWKISAAGSSISIDTYLAKPNTNEESKMC